jgi:carbon-monoxide dehydrogenase small subunit
MTNDVTIDLTLNGQPCRHTIEARETLADFIRDRCGLTATHLGCEHGACGACTVVVDGRPTRACLMLAAMADGRDVRTLEGLAEDPTLVALKRFFHEKHALQCGFCTPGMLIMARDILARHRAPGVATIRNELSGQICRCTGYANIVAAIEAAGKESAGSPARAGPGSS